MRTNSRHQNKPTNGYSCGVNQYFKATSHLFQKDGVYVVFLSLLFSLEALSQSLSPPKTFHHVSRNSGVLEYYTDIYDFDTGVEGKSIALRFKISSLPDSPDGFSGDHSSITTLNSRFTKVREDTRKVALLCGHIIYFHLIKGKWVTTRPEWTLNEKGHEIIIKNHRWVLLYRKGQIQQASLDGKLVLQWERDANGLIEKVLNHFDGRNVVFKHEGSPPRLAEIHFPNDHMVLSYTNNVLSRCVSKKSLNLLALDWEASSVSIRRTHLDIDDSGRVDFQRSSESFSWGNDGRVISGDEGEYKYKEFPGKGGLSLSHTSKGGVDRYHFNPSKGEEIEGAGDTVYKTVYHLAPGPLYLQIKEKIQISPTPKVVFRNFYAADGALLKVEFQD